METARDLLAGNPGNYAAAVLVGGLLALGFLAWALRGLRAAEAAGG